MVNSQCVIQLHALLFVSAADLNFIHIKLNKMKNKLFITNDSWSMVILRVVLGLVVFAHGAQKLFGWFGGYGFEGSMNYFTNTVGLPWIIGFIVIILEFFGA